MKEPSHEPVLRTQIDCKGEIRIAEVLHTADFSDQKIQTYEIYEHAFAMHAFHSSGFRTFEGFIGEEYWRETTTALTISYDLLQLIGERIDDHYA